MTLKGSDSSKEAGTLLGDEVLLTLQIDIFSGCTILILRAVERLEGVYSIAKLLAIRKWITARRSRNLRPGELIRDDRVPEILLTLKSPTFITIDRGFWDYRLCHPKYCILYFDLRDDQQELIPDLLRALLRRTEFRSRANRMGKVVHISTKAITYWQFQSAGLKRIRWKT